MDGSSANLEVASLRGEVEAINPVQHKAELYKDPTYVSLYRFENPTIPYDRSREGIVSKEAIIGQWYTDNLSDLVTYTAQHIKGVRGGRFAVVRIPKADLEKYDATLLPETRNMDIERGNYIIPPEIGAESRIEIEAPFKDSWEGRKNIPLMDYRELRSFIEAHLSDDALVAMLSS
jgi:hypothetical protein